MMSGPVEAALTDAPTLIPLGEHAHFQPITFRGPIALVGSGEGVHIRLRSRSISSVHAMLLQVGERVIIRDLASSKHVYVNGRLTRQATLHTGAEIAIGRMRLRYEPPGRVSEQSADWDEALPPTLARLWRQSGKVIPIAGPIVLIGSKRDVDVIVDGADVAPAHAVLHCADGDWFMRDLCTRTGTAVNDRKVAQALLRDGDVIQVGDERFQFERAAAVATCVSTMSAGAKTIRSSVSVPANSEAPVEKPARVGGSAPNGISDLEPPRRTDDQGYAIHSQVQPHATPATEASLGPERLVSNDDDGGAFASPTADTDVTAKLSPEDDRSFNPQLRADRSAAAAQDRVAEAVTPDERSSITALEANSQPVPEPPAREPLEPQWEAQSAPPAEPVWSSGSPKGEAGMRAWGPLALALAVQSRPELLTTQRGLSTAKLKVKRTWLWTSVGAAIVVAAVGAFGWILLTARGH